MPVVLFLFLVTGTLSGELPGRCEIDYRKCTFDCVQEFPLDKEKREGCLTRCKLDRGLCEVRERMKDTVDSVRRFLEGFSREK